MSYHQVRRQRGRRDIVGCGCDPLFAAKLLPIVFPEMQTLDPFRRGGMTAQKRQLIAVCQNQQQPWRFRNAIYLLSAKANPTRSPVRATACTSASNSRVLKSTNCSNTMKVSLHDQY
jgi:hypothetical protein